MHVKLELKYYCMYSVTIMPIVMAKWAHCNYVLDVHVLILSVDCCQ